MTSRDRKPALPRREYVRLDITPKQFQTSNQSGQHPIGESNPKDGIPSLEELRAFVESRKPNWNNKYILSDLIVQDMIRLPKHPHSPFPEGFSYFTPLTPQQFYCAHMHQGNPRDTLATGLSAGLWPSLVIPFAIMDEIPSAEKIHFFLRASKFATPHLDKLLLFVRGMPQLYQYGFRQGHPPGTEDLTSKISIRQYSPSEEQQIQHPWKKILEKIARASSPDVKKAAGRFLELAGSELTIFEPLFSRMYRE